MLGPLIQGQTRPTWTMTILQSNNSPLDITGATFTGVLYDRARATAYVMAGVFALSDPTNGIFTYAPVAADIAVPGTFEVEFCLTISTQPYYLRTADPLVINERYAT